MIKVQVRGPNGFVVEFSVDKNLITLGRDPESDIYLPSGMASRNHARIFVKDGVVYIEDLNSSNGTFVKNKKILIPEPIKEEDPVKLGDVYLRVNYVSKKAPVLNNSGSYSVAQRLGNRDNTVNINSGEEKQIREMLSSPFASGPFKTVKD